MSSSSAAAKPLGKTRTDWTGSLTLIPPAVILAVLLYFDREMHVTDAFPLKGHPTPPLTAFLLMATLGFPAGAMLLLGAWLDYWRAEQSKSWPAVTGRMLVSEVSVRLGKGPRNLPDVSYEYEVDGSRYESSRIRFGQGRTRFRAQAEELVGRYPVGSEVEVRYNPADPGVAVLDTSDAAVQSAVWWGVAWLAFPFLGFSESFRAMING
jgi:hypothetical protein